MYTVYVYANISLEYFQIHLEGLALFYHGVFMMITVRNSLLILDFISLGKWFFKTKYILGEIR